MLLMLTKYVSNFTIAVLSRSFHKVTGFQFRLMFFPRVIASHLPRVSSSEARYPSMVAFNRSRPQHDSLVHACVSALFHPYKTDINLSLPTISFSPTKTSSTRSKAPSKSKTTPIHLTTFVAMPRYQIGGYSTAVVQ